MSETFSDCGVLFVAGFEAFYPFVYDDLVYPTREWHQGEAVRGTLTIGYGETDPSIVRPGRHCTEDEARGWFLDSIAKRYLPSVLAAVGDDDQWRLDSLVSFTYNLGPGVISNPQSSLRLAIDQGGNVAAAMSLYVRSGGQVLQGLVRRRAAEGRLYEAGDYGFACSVPVLHPWRGEDGDEYQAAA